MITFKERVKWFLPAVLVMMQTNLPAAVSAYTQPASVVAAGGGSSSSASYGNIGIIAQPGIVGMSSSASYSADHGFLPVLGGWRILYPVISATPGTLTFTLSQGAGDSKPLAIANAGGSTLKWNVAKGGASSWLSFSPANGTGNASVTVTADAAGLSAGSYNGALTVSGAGISETLEVQITLTVNPGSLYRLTLTVKSDTAGRGGGSVHGDGISCAGAGSQGSVCTADLQSGSVLTLVQSPDSNSTWASWTGLCTPSGNDCEVTMSGDRSVIATFPYAYMAKVNSSGGRYDTLTDALTHAAATDTILARDVTFSGDLTLTGKIITIIGGLSPWYSPQNAWTTLSGGRLTIQSGSLTMEGLVIK